MKVKVPGCLDMFTDIKHPLNGPNHVEIPYYTMVAGGCRILGGIRRDYSMTLSSTVFEMMIRCWCRAITTPGERWIWSWTLWHDLKMSKPSRRWLIWGNYKFDGIQVGVCVWGITRVHNEQRYLHWVWSCVKQQKWNYTMPCPDRIDRSVIIASCRIPMLCVGQ